MAQSVRPKILIADSYKSHTETLSGYLNELTPAIEVYSAPEGREALSETAVRDIHLFLVNGFLKGPLNGFELCRSIRRLDAHQHTPIIMVLSGHLMSYHERGLHAGADLFLHQPVEKQELWRMVVLLLNEYSQRRRRETSAADTQDLELIEIKPFVRILH